MRPFIKNFRSLLARNAKFHLFGGNFLHLIGDADRGDVWWLNRSEAFSQQLVYINEMDQVVMKVDNASYVAWNDKRNSVRIESRDLYGVGSLWIVDIAHVPYGCSVSLLIQPVVLVANGLFRFQVWPAFWSYGKPL